MKVKEALELFNIKTSKKIQWDHHTSQYTINENSEPEIYSHYHMDSLSTDRKLLESNFESEVLMIDHIGFIGVMGFKMRNGRYAIFAFNSPCSMRSIERVNKQKYFTEFDKFKESVKKNFNTESEEIALWLALGAVGGTFK